MATRIVDGWGGIENGLPVLMAHLVENQLTESDGYGVRRILATVATSAQSLPSIFLVALVTIEWRGPGPDKA